MDDRVSHPWHANFSASSTCLGLSYLTPCIKALWMPNAASTLPALLPRYLSVHFLLTCNRKGPDEPREVEPHPLNTAIISHQYNFAWISQEPDSGNRYIVQSGSYGSRNSVGVYGSPVGILITALNRTRTCERECMHGRPDDGLRSPNENVSQSSLLGNPRREVISGASCLTMAFRQLVCSQIQTTKYRRLSNLGLWDLVQDLRIS